MTPSDIQDYLCQAFGISLEQMLSHRRVRAYSYPRMLAMYFCRMHTDLSLTQIGKAFDRDHTTVLHAVKWATTNDEALRYVDILREPMDLRSAIELAGEKC